MKGRMAALVAAALLLSACGAPAEGEIPAPSATPSGKDIKWSGEGGCYSAERREASENYIFGSAICTGNDTYYIAFDSSGGKNEYSLMRNGAALYSTAKTMERIAQGNNGIWVLEASEGRYQITLVDYTGAAQTSISADALGITTELKRIYSCGETLYVFSEGLVVSVDAKGEKLAEYSVGKETSSLVFDSAGNPYAVKHSASDNVLTPLEEGEPVSVGPGVVGSGSGEVKLALGTDDGIFALEEDGGVSPVVLWRECGISIGAFLSLVSLDDGGFFCQCKGGMYYLRPTTPDKLMKKTELTIATIGGNDALRASAADFSQQSRDYVIRIIDYTDGGGVSEDQAKQRLAADIIGGHCPDMLSFENLSPYIYASRGYLMDLTEFFVSDNEVSLDDIATPGAFSAEKGIYFIGNDFSVETFLGLEKNFGDRLGMTIAEYLELEAHSAPGAETVYTTTKEMFLENVAKRYTRTTADRENGSCNFESPEFIEILNASMKIRENPEPTDVTEMNFTLPGLRLAEGSLLLSITWVDSVSAIAKLEREAGAPLTCVGWPTPDGSCGSDVFVHLPTGITTETKNPGGCWAYIKYLFTRPPENYGLWSLPLYLPALRGSLQLAMKPDENGFAMSEADAEKFLSFLGSIDQVAIYDESILDIIMEEAGAFFAGDKTAEETAALIQSRASLYMSEQYG